MFLALLIAILAIVTTGLGFLTNVLAAKYQPQLEPKTRAVIIVSGFFLTIIVLVSVAIAHYSGSDHPPPPSEETEDQLKITSIKTVEDSETEISSFADQGVISVYWDIMLSNVGRTNLSVTSYDVKQVGETFTAVSYSGMNQGLFEFEDGYFRRLDLPIVLNAGTSRKIFVRLGLLIVPESYALIKHHFPNSPKVTLQPIWHFLFSKGTDFYGNKIERLPKNTGYRLPSQDQVREQEFVISFKTSRDVDVAEPLSWYKFGGAYDRRRQ